jgi:hypothetical protein
MDLKEERFANHLERDSEQVYHFHLIPFEHGGMKIH